jgi:aspartate-semialdehyde dehydrogenase
MGYKVAVVGATGAVGREVIKTLAERGFPVDSIVALASGRLLGVEISFGEKIVLKTQSLEKHDFKASDLALFCGTAAVAAAHAPRAAAAGCMVVDLSDQFHLEFDVPLVVPEVNPQALARATKRRIVATPSASVIQLAMALKPLHDIARVKRVVVSTYQAVSGAGKEAMDELWSQTRGLFVNELGASEQFTKQMAFNVIPHIDQFMDDGATREEWKLAVETRKVLDPDVHVVATCVRVPVFIGNGMAVTVEFEGAIAEEQASRALHDFAGVIVLDKRDDAGYVTPAETVGEDVVYVSRIRRDPTVPHGLAFWCVADNLRKGAALNAVQVAELLHERGMLGKPAR